MLLDARGGRCRAVLLLAGVFWHQNRRKRKRIVKSVRRLNQLVDLPEALVHLATQVIEAPVYISAQIIDTLVNIA